MKLKYERLATITYYLPRSLLSRIRNFIMGISFNSKGLIVCEGTFFNGSKNIELGDFVSIGRYCWIDSIEGGKIILGDNVSLSQNVHIASSYKVVIEKDALIGSDVLITDHDHEISYEFLDLPPKNRPLRVKSETIVGERVWLGDNVKILSGVKIGRNSVVAANSVVRDDFPCNSLIAGSPAKLVRKLI